LYVGIKQSGSFQHSSFLRGARLSAAGLIEIKEGRLTKLSPLSGHYRPPTSNFRDFVHTLERRKVDMSQVSISKTYALLIGLEAYATGRRKLKETTSAIIHIGRKSHKKEATAPEKKQMTEDEIATKECYDGGVDNHHGVRSGIKDLRLVASPRSSLSSPKGPPDLGHLTPN
jgi:hypothetical protein